MNVGPSSVRLHVCSKSQRHTCCKASCGLIVQQDSRVQSSTTTAIIFRNQEVNAFPTPISLSLETVTTQARQVEAFIINGGQKQKILAPRWRSMTGKRLLRLKHGQRVGLAAKVKGRRRDRQGNGSRGGGGVGGDAESSSGPPAPPPLSGLEEEGSDTSINSSSGSEDGN